MKTRTRRFCGVSLMALGPGLTLLSPWIVISSPVTHAFIYDEGWLLLSGGGCIWMSQLKVPNAIAWSGALMLIGISVLFLGVRLYTASRAGSFAHT